MEVTKRGEKGGEIEERMKIRVKKKIGWRELRGEGRNEGIKRDKKG